MATVYVPGVALTSISGKIGAQPWACVFHWQFGTQTAKWSQADLDLLANTVLTAWTTVYGPVCGNNTTWTTVVASDLTDASSLQAQSSVAGGSGSQTGPHDPASACVLVRNKIKSRYRGGHPRTYYPFGMTSQMQNESQWDPAFISSLTPIVRNWVSTVTGAAYTVTGAPLGHVIVRYAYKVTNDTAHSKYLRERIPPGTPYPVADYQAMAPIASQRKRLTL